MRTQSITTSNRAREASSFVFLPTPAAQIATTAVGCSQWCSQYKHACGAVDARARPTSVTLSLCGVLGA
jgi:hypothetical protein